jgi:Leucine Rich repeat
MNATRHFLAVPLLTGFAIFLTGCSSSPPPNTGTGTTTGKTGEEAPTETVKPTSKEDPKAKAAAESLEKSGAKLVRREEVVVRVELGPEGSDADLAMLKDLPTVEALVADKRGVTDKGLESLAGHPGLKTLDLTLSGITNGGLAHLANLPKLEEVNLKRCDITAAGYEALAKIKSLKRIRAPQTHFNGDCLAALQDCSWLELLDLQDCNEVPKAKWKVLDNFKNLKSLRLWGPTVDDSTLEFILGAKNLKSLFLESTEVTAPGLEKLTVLANVQTISLTNAKNIFDAELEPIGKFKELTSLELRNCGLNGKGLVHLAGLKRLKLLDLSETFVKDQRLEHLSGLTNLEDLNLWHTQVTDAGLVHLESLVKLKRLNLDACKISAQGTPHLRPLTELEFLHIGSTQVDDAGLESLGELKKLKTLVITFLPNVTDEGVNKLKARLPGLTEIRR